MSATPTALPPYASDQSYTSIHEPNPMYGMNVKAPGEANGGACVIDGTRFAAGCVGAGAGGAVAGGNVDAVVGEAVVGGTRVPVARISCPALGCVTSTANEPHSDTTISAVVARTRPRDASARPKIMDLSLLDETTAVLLA